MFNRSVIAIVVLCFVSATMSASISTESLAASINEVQKRFAAVPKDKRIIDSSSSTSSDSSSSSSIISYDQKSDTSELEMPASERPAPSVTSDIEKPTPKPREKHRNDKMLDFYRYYAAQAASGATAPVAAPPSYSFPYYPYYNPYYQQPYVSAYYSPYYSPIVDPAQTAEEYDDVEYPESNDVDGGETDEDGSRANKRRPGGGKNSPIFYIRLPPTPYMFVPGMGYISQPPTIQPLTPQYPINPFINLPITYLSNAKPTGVFPWGQQGPSNFASPQFPSYLPPRPQKPYRPKPPQMGGAPTPTQDSKITHLGSYLFNGRPDGIYLMPPPYPNPYAAPYPIPNPYQPPSPYTQASPYSAPSPYNPYSPPPYNPYSYAPPPALPSYY